LQNALDTPQARMAQITREQADTMSIADLAAAVGDPTRYDDIVVRALREIRMNESPASTVVDAIINGGQIGNHDLSTLTPVERELIARDVTDAVSVLSAASAAPRNTLRQDMVSAYVTSLQHPDESVNNALQNIRNVMDTMTIDMQGRGETPVAIGGELLNDISERIRNVQSLVDRRETITNLTMQGTDAVLNGLIEARQNVAEAMIRHAEQQAAQARAQRQEQPQAGLPSILEFVENVRRTEGLQVGDRVETVAFRVGENINPRANPLEYAQALRRAADTEESELVDMSLRQLADAFEEGHIGAIVDAMLPDDQHGANQPVPNTPPVVEPTEQQADLFRDVYSRPHGQDHVYISSDQAGLLVDDELSNVMRTYGQDVGERVGRVVEDILEHMSFEDNPHGVINRLRRHTAQGPLQTRANVEQGLLDIAQRLDEEFTAAYNEREEQRMQSAPVPRDVLNLSDDALAQRLSPADIGSIDASFEAMMADNSGFAADGVPTLPAAAMLTRRFNVYDLDNYAREALARRFEAEHRDRQQLAVQPAPEVAEPQQGRSIRELYEEFNDAIANAIEEGDFDPTNYSNADLAQFVLDDAMGGGLTDLTDGERQALADVVRQRGFDGDLDNLPAQQPNVADADIDDELIQYTMGPYSEAVEEIAEDSGRPEAVREIDRVIQDLRDGEDEIYAFLSGEVLTPAIRQALIDRLLALRREYRDEPPQGYAKGGVVMPVSKYMGNPTLAGLAYKYGGYVH